MNEREAMAYLDLTGPDIRARHAPEDWEFGERYRERKTLDVVAALTPPPPAGPMSGLAWSRMEAQVLHMLCAARIAGDTDKAVKAEIIAGALSSVARMERLAARAERG